jgi:hypothetical protein
MLQKLAWEINGLREQIESQPEKVFNHLDAAYFAFNAAVTAWHLSDWTWASIPDQNKREVATSLQISSAKYEDFAEALRGKSRALAICHAIANGSKHKTDRGDKSLKVSLEWVIEEGKAGALRAGEPLVKYRYELIVFDGNQRRTALDIFDEVFIFWRRFLSQWGFVDPKFIFGNIEEFDPEEENF